MAGRASLSLRIRFPINPHDNKCHAILDKYNVTAQTDFLESCCATFILPGERIRALPADFYDEMRLSMMTQHNDVQSGRPCFEYLVIRIMGERSIRSQPEVEQWYNSVPQRGITHTCTT